MRAVTTTYADIEPEPVRWLVPGLVPLGKLTVLEGDPGTGKSTVLTDLAARVTRGEGLPGDPSYPPASVLMLCGEDGEADTVRPRLDAAGADVSRVEKLDGFGYGSEPILDFIIGGSRAKESYEALERVIHEKDIRLVTIDMLMEYLSGEHDAYRDHDIRQALRPLAKLAKETKCAIIIVRHLRKGGSAKATHAGGGSIGIGGAARSVLLVDRDPVDSDRRVLAVVKCNLAELAPSRSFSLVSAPSSAARIEWLGMSPYTAEALTLARSELGATSHKPRKIDACAFWLRDLLQGGELESKQIFALAEAKEFSRATIERAAQSIGVSKRSQGFSEARHAIWALPSSAPTPLNPLTDPSGDGLMGMASDEGTGMRLSDAELAIEREAIQGENEL